MDYLLIVVKSLDLFANLLLDVNGISLIHKTIGRRMKNTYVCVCFSAVQMLSKWHWAKLTIRMAIKFIGEIEWTFNVTITTILLINTWSIFTSEHIHKTRFANLFLTFISVLFYVARFSMSFVHFSNVMKLWVWIENVCMILLFGMNENEWIYIWEFNRLGIS